MRKKGIMLKNSVDFPFERRQMIDIFALKQDVPTGLLFKAANDPQGSCLATAAGTQERNKFVLQDIEIQTIQNRAASVVHANVNKFDEFLGHACPPFFPKVYFSLIRGYLSPAEISENKTVPTFHRHGIVPSSGWGLDKAKSELRRRLA
jgi:hypothetical protein